LAVIVTVPKSLQVAKPEALMEQTLADEEVQATEDVPSTILPSS